MNPSPTVGGRFAAKVVGGGVPDAPRRGQDPSLQIDMKRGGFHIRPCSLAATVPLRFTNASTPSALKNLPDETVQAVQNVL